MDLDRASFLLLAAAIGCHEHAAVQRVELSPVPPPSRAPASPTDCANLLEHNRRVLAQPSVECPSDDQATSLTKGHTSDALFNYCHEGHGTWFIELLTSTVTGPAGESGGCEARAQYRLHFAARDHTAASEPLDWYEGPDETIETAVMGQLDYDGDGADELVLGAKSWANGGGSDQTASVLRAHSGHVEAYPVGFKYDGAIDADGDGRIDLTTSTFYSAAEPCVGLYETYRYGVPMLIHSLPNGAFSMSDDVARRWARKKCPDPPTPTADPSCRRLWGEPVTRITQGLSTVDQCGGSSEQELVAKLVAPDPPFTPLNVP